MSRGGGGGGMSRGGGGGGGARPPWVALAAEAGRPCPDPTCRVLRVAPNPAADPRCPTWANGRRRSRPMYRPSMGGVSRPNASLPSTRPGGGPARDLERHGPAPAASLGLARRPPRLVRRHRRDRVEVVGFPETSGRIVRASARVAPVRCRLAPVQVARLRIGRASVRVARARSLAAPVRVAQSEIDRVRAVVIDRAWATSRAIVRAWVIGLVDGPAIGL